MRQAMVAAILAGILVTGAGRAADADEQAIRATIHRMFENWGALNPDANDPYYAADAGAVWYDVAPLQYVGWAAYKEGVKKLFADVATANFKLHDDLVVHRAGKLAWVTYAWTAEMKRKDGKAETMEGRGTDILEKRKGGWVIVHEHVSVPAPL
jgi:ketosteroid isomerase-like protein